MECSLKKPEEFFKSSPVHYNDKVFVVGCLDKDVHVFTPKVKKWFLLEKWFVDWWDSLFHVLITIKGLTIQIKGNNDIEWDF